MSVGSDTISKSTDRLLNFGCGTVFHPDWVNLDAAPVAPIVRRHDLTSGFPFSANTFDGVYGSHVLEHLDVDAAHTLLRECYRTLKPKGIVRIVVPDLEAIAKLYVASLSEAQNGDPEARLRYDWIMLELYDQSVRSVSGGKMAEQLNKAGSKGYGEFILSRIGAEAAPSQPAVFHNGSVLWRSIRWARSHLLRLRCAVASICVFVALGPQGNAALREGLFRRSGEVHQWMYDRFSLTRALEAAGFSEIRVSAADQSEIPGFAGYDLEMFNGTERKPDSLYIEARKPARS